VEGGKRGLSGAFLAFLTGQVGGKGDFWDFLAASFLGKWGLNGGFWGVF
jgi:hypothetical protein